MRHLLLLALAPLAGCGTYCTLMWAPSTLGVEFEAESWDPGTYEIELNGYNQYAMCVVTLPFVEGDPVHCTDNVMGLEMNDAGDAIDRMTLVDFAPDAFGIEVLDGAGLVAEDTFTPSYAVDEPNGEDCGERRSATVTMRL